MEAVILVALVWGGVALYLYVSNLKERAENADEMPALVLRANAGDADAQAMLGNRYHRGPNTVDYAEAFKWFSAAARQGHLGGITMMGVMYRNGEYVEKDIGKAEAAFKIAAQAGGLRAQTLLGLLYAEEIGSGENAIHWLLIATRGADSIAMSSLAEIFEVGVLTQKDLVKACFWYTAAAKAGPVTDLYQIKAQTLKNGFTSEQAAAYERLVAQHNAL